MKIGQVRIEKRAHLNLGDRLTEYNKEDQVGSRFLFFISLSFLSVNEEVKDLLLLDSKGALDLAINSIA